MTKDRTILHCDCNGFFASVECLLRPELNNFPVAVCGNPETRHGIILAKNEKAKAFGISTAETIWSAKQKCPNLVIVPPHRYEYEKYSRMCNEIYLRFTDLVEPFGIDESYLDVTGSLHLFGSGQTIADTIRKIIREELGFTVSVGVSFNKIFAKLGSDYKKPDATTVITRETEKGIVSPLPVSALLFVGRKANDKLFKLGIKTIGDLAKTDRNFLISILGSLGGQIHDHANGLDNSPVASYYSKTEAKSIGNGTTFEYNVTDYDDLKGRVLDLCDSVASRMRKHGVKCTTLQISIKDPDFKTINRQIQLKKPTNLTKELFKTAMEIMDKNWQKGKPIRLVTVTASKLINKNEEQLSVFDSDSKKDEAIQTAIDQIRNKYGRNKIGIAKILKREINGNINKFKS